MVEAVARRYFEAVAAADWDAVAQTADGASLRLIGKRKLRVPEELRAFVEAIRASFPDASFELEKVSADGELAAARWRLSGSFNGAPFEDVTPTGKRAEIEACEVVRVRDGVIDRSNIYLECSALAARLGTVEWMIAEPELELVADGVWLLRGGYPLRSMNAFLIEEPGRGVTVFDTGISAMAGPLKDAADRLGGANRIILGHGHSDHRGSAKALGVPVYCHPAEVADAEGDGGAHYMDLRKLTTPSRWVMTTLVRAYDGPPPTIAGTVQEGHDIAGFTVVDLPGHAPGLIGLWRAEDRLALVSDCFYVTDMEAFGKPAPPQIPHRATTLDYELAGMSIRKLAALEPAAAWPGHLGPVTGDVRAVLESAADAGAPRGTGSADAAVAG
jgi:glyoxylase-like metal-dependent hydrolase (beta-lactamase superfamily II)/predicted ester cyclase